MESTLSADAQEFIPRMQQPGPIVAEEKKYTSLAPSWIIRSHNYQIATESIIEGLKDPVWGDQSYIFLDASSVRMLSLNQHQEDTKSYVFSQREFYVDKNIMFDRNPSDIYLMGLASGYMRLDKGEVAVHESGLFSIPYYFGGIVNGLLQIGGVVPQNKLKPAHQSPGNLLKAHNSQDLLFLSYINPHNFKSLVCVTKLAAHRIYMTQERGVYGYSTPNWILTTFGPKHYATIKYGIPFEELVDAMAAHMKDSNKKFRRDTYNSIIKKFTKKIDFIQFDGNEVAKWRANDHYNLHRHKFSLDLLAIEKYETAVTLRYREANNPDSFTAEEVNALKELDKDNVSLVKDRESKKSRNRESKKSKTTFNIMDFVKTKPV